MILLVDGTNQFIRAYTAFSTCTTNGDPCGGIFGFLCTLGSIMGLTSPSKVIIAFDAPGGSARRRKLYSEYKEGRKPPRLNRKFDIGSEKEKENKKAQEVRLREYLKDLPVSMVCVQNIEADDVLAYLCLLHPDERKVIVSSDQDFIQLLDGNTMLYRPTKKSFYSLKDCLAEHNIHPKNFALARAFVGDTSDNLPGVAGIGLKRLIKYVPQFSGTEMLTLDEVFDFCRGEDPKRFQSFLDAERQVRDNYKIMQLREPLISLASVSKIKSVAAEQHGMNSTGFRTKLIKDGLDIGDKFLTAFLKLSVANKSGT